MCEAPREGRIHEHPRVNQWMFQSFDLSAWGYIYQVYQGSSTAWPQFFLSTLYLLVFDTELIFVVRLKLYAVPERASHNVVQHNGEGLVC